MSFLSNVLTRLFPKGLDHVEVDDALNYSTEDVQHFDEVINTYNGTQQLNSRLREVIDNESIYRLRASALCQLQWAGMPNDFCFALHHALKTHLLDMSYRIERARLKRFSEGQNIFEERYYFCKPKLQYEGEPPILIQRYGNIELIAKVQVDPSNNQVSEDFPVLTIRIHHYEGHQYSKVLAAEDLFQEWIQRLN
ncbi:MAG: hypothetical protein VXX18_04250 [Bacteroidota bacterium]|nr:hypothetical protein [Bacteroidota bacterium]